MAPTRKFIDSDGIHWQVYEISSDSAAGDLRAESWLYFFSRDATRSLTTYPDDWSLMDWPGLQGLCHRARPPVKREPKRPAAIAHSADF